MSKLAKAEVDYRPSESGDTRCGRCSMFRAGTCTLVTGRIDPRDVCDRFEPAKVAASLDSGQAIGLTRVVRAYERAERVRGRLRLEAVHGYQSSAQGRKLLKAAEGMGRKYVPGQGFFVDAKGEKHWGWYGGAGLLIHHQDGAGARRYLLQKRSWSVQHGGTWSVPGGAIDAPGGVVETPAAAALREGREELGKLPGNLTVTGTDAQHFGTPGEPGYWAYHTVSMASPEQFEPGKGSLKGKATHGFESAQTRWVTPEEMAKLPLHPAFRATALKLGMPDVPNPPPEEKSSWQAAADPAKPSDYAKGEVVTWRYNGHTIEGEVAGWHDKPPKDKLPNRYKVKITSGPDRGKVVPVEWGQLRLKSPPAPAGKAAPVFPGGTSLAGKLGESLKAAGGPVAKYPSRAVPGMVHQVPVSAGSEVWEHKFSGTLAVRAGPGHDYRVYDKGLRGRSVKPAKETGWQQLSAKQADSAHSGPLGKVVSAGEKLVPSPAVPAKAKLPAEKPAADPYWATQAAAAGLKPGQPPPPGPVRKKDSPLAVVRTAHAAARARGMREASRSPRGGRNAVLRRGQALRKELEGRE